MSILHLTNNVIDTACCAVSAGQSEIDRQSVKITRDEIISKYPRQVSTVEFVVRDK